MGSSLSNGFILVELMTELFAIEIFSEHLLHFGDTSTTADEKDLIDLIFFKKSCLEGLIDWLDAIPEDLLADLFKLSSRHFYLKILTFHELIDNDFSRELVWLAEL